MNTLPFDEIYCIHCVEYNDRYRASIEMFNKLGILDNVKFWYTCKRPISKYCGDKLLSLHSKYYNDKKKKYIDVYAGVFNCALEHYTLIKTAYIRGLDHILVFEDDLMSWINEEEFQLILDNLPTDYDFILFNNDYKWDEISKKKLKEFKDNNFFIKHTPHEKKSYASTGCYALSRKGMEYYINFNDFSFSYSDKFWNHINPEKYNFYEIGPKIFQPKFRNSIILNETYNKENITSYNGEKEYKYSIF